MANEQSPLTLSISNIRMDDWVNPFGATPEELLAGTLEEGGLLSDDTAINGQSAQALFHVYNRKRRQFQEATRLGTLLVKSGVVTQEQLTEALFRQKKENIPLGEILVSLGYCTQEAIETSLERQRTLRQEMEKMEQYRQEKLSLWKKIVYFFKEPSAP
jgi:hypothetical protein